MASLNNLNRSALAVFGVDESSVSVGGIGKLHDVGAWLVVFGLTELFHSLGVVDIVEATICSLHEQITLLIVSILLGVPNFGLNLG